MSRESEVFTNIPSWLSQPHVHIKSPEEVITKINTLIKEGKEKLQIIFDYDRTVTKHHDNGVITLSSFSMLENLPNVPESFHEDNIKLREKNLAIELDPNMSVEEKIPYMMEWWTIALERLRGLSWRLDEVDQHLRDHRQPVREWASDCFANLARAGVPTLVFSAGVGDVVTMCLDHEGLLTPNVHVASNFLDIRDEKVTGWKGEIITVFNKNEHAIENTPYFKELSGRSNVILVGDSEGDVRMADGVPHDVVLKIGFLNAKIEESLERYLELFDIVLADDQTMTVLLNLLESILRK